MNHLFQALSDPTRRKILDISHHLDILKRANLVVAEKEGQYITYSINTTELDEIIKWMYQLSGNRNK